MAFKILERREHDAIMRRHRKRTPQPQPPQLKLVGKHRIPSPQKQQTDEEMLAALDAL